MGSNAAAKQSLSGACRPFTAAFCTQIDCRMAVLGNRKRSNCTRIDSVGAMFVASFAGKVHTTWTSGAPCADCASLDGRSQPAHETHATTPRNATASSRRTIGVARERPRP